MISVAWNPWILVQMDSYDCWHHFILTNSFHNVVWRHKTPVLLGHCLRFCRHSEILWSVRPRPKHFAKLLCCQFMVFSFFFLNCMVASKASALDLFRCSDPYYRWIISFACIISMINCSSWPMLSLIAAILCTYLLDFYEMFQCVPSLFHPEIVLLSSYLCTIVRVRETKCFLLNLSRFSCSCSRTNQWLEVRDDLGCNDGKGLNIIDFPHFYCRIDLN